MRSVVFAAIVGLGLLGVGVIGEAPRPTSADNGAMGSPAATPAASPAAVCTPIEIARGDLVGYMPPGMLEGAVSLHVPPGTPDDGKALYLTVLTMPPTSCMDFRVRSGAVVLYVQEGTIEYTARAVSPDPAHAPSIQMGDSGGIDGDVTPVALDTPVTLHATDWITQDRTAWFTFRNAGATDAVVSVAEYVTPWDDDNCGGGCRKP